MVVMVGLICTRVLFYHFPKLPAAEHEGHNNPSISVVIPARNEEKNLPLLLKDIKAQSLPAMEIICVDDASEDDTARIALLHGAKVISLHDKPDSWIGKSWACQKGAETASGEAILFLDADVRLGMDSLLRLARTYSKSGSTISVQPFHKTEQAYEQLSMVFNLVQLAANGIALAKPTNFGLCGPIILISKTDYQTIGGHESAKNSVIEDVALGEQLTKKHVPFQIFVGDEDFSYRMYSAGLRGLIQGWQKNLALGASRVQSSHFWMVFFWIASMSSIGLQLVRFSIAGDTTWLGIYLVMYAIWVVILFLLTKQVGRFQPWVIVLFPISAAVFLGVFSVSMFKRVFGIKVMWKGRAV